MHIFSMVCLLILVFVLVSAPLGENPKKGEQMAKAFLLALAIFPLLYLLYSV